MSPLSGGQVQPVQVSAVKVASCSSKHIEIAIYDDHCLEVEYNESLWLDYLQAATAAAEK